MKTVNIFDAFFLSNPLYRGTAEKILLVGTGICGLVYDWKSFSISPISNILGVILILLAYAFHHWAQRDHRQAHKKYQDIETIVTTGVFSKIRHPLYLSLILQNIGIALAFGTLIPGVLALLTIVHWIITALKEEAVLLQTFPDQYTRYRREVRWLMIPGIF